MFSRYLLNLLLLHISNAIIAYVDNEKSSILKEFHRFLNPRDPEDSPTHEDEPTQERNVGREISFARDGIKFRWRAVGVERSRCRIASQQVNGNVCCRSDYF